MQISIFGSGYVGLVTGVCFSEMGNDVICADIDKQKVQTMSEGKSPIFEPGLEEMMNSNIRAKRLSFTTDIKKAIHSSPILMIAVGTPSDKDGSADLRHVVQVAEEIAREMNENKCIIIKSTVPVGTNRMISSKIQAILDQKKSSYRFDLVSNPEFLREGAAIEESMKPARVVVGTSSDDAADLLRRMYEPFLKKGQPILFMDPTSAELTKYAANSMLATRISLMNELARLSEKVGADIELVRRGLGTDPRIGPHFIYPGIGYGGSCFPKDVRALIKTGEEHDERLEILEAVVKRNDKQKQHFAIRVGNALRTLKGKKIAVWGIAFKPFTDDIREAPALEVIDALIEQGATVQAFDPAANENAKSHFGSRSQLHFYEDQYDALEGTVALCVITEWKSFREPNFNKMKSKMKELNIFDGRNIYNPRDISNEGFTYYSIGRPQIGSSK